MEYLQTVCCVYSAFMITHIWNKLHKKTNNEKDR